MTGQMYAELNNAASQVVSGVGTLVSGEFGSYLFFFAGVTVLIWMVAKFKGGR